MRRLALVMAVAMASGRAYALGLGDIELHSALNQPLNAEVRLLVDNPKELEGAAIVLAPNDEFVRAGIERPAILTDLKFNIVTDKSGAQVVKITSTQPIRDPFLDFVVQLRWSSGQLLREYTVLLDPPVFGEEQQTAAVAAPTAAAPAPMTPPAPQPSASAAAPAAAVPAPAPIPAAPPAPAPVAAPAPRPAPAPRAAHRPAAPAAAPATKAVSAPPAMAAPQAASVSQGNYGPTKRNDTLWYIANEVRPDDSVTVYQMMLALLKENPQAFYNNNINSLKAGYVLRVPDKAEAALIARQQAVQEAARQYQQWQQAKRGGVSPSESSQPAEQAASSAPAASQSKDKDSARLRLVAPSDSAGGAAGGGMQAELDKLRADLALAMESSDTAKREGDELRSRVAALEEQINSLQRLITLKDQALSDMQKRSGLEVPAAAQTPAAAPVSAAPAAGEQTPPVKPAVKPKPAPQAAEPAPSLLSDPTIMGAAGGAALLLLSVGWLMVRRRGHRAEDEEAVEPVFGDGTMPALNIQLPGAGAMAPAMDEMHDAHGNDAEMKQVAEEMAQQAEQEMPKTAGDLDVMSTPEGEIDPIVEADVYLAYRRYQQAEALVQSALSKQPNRQDLQAKLLDIHYAAKNSEAFRKVAQSLYINLGSNDQDPLWQRILPMGRELCPNEEMFVTRARKKESTPVAEAASALEEANVTPKPAAAIPADDEKMEFDLNLGGDAAVAEAEAPAAVVADEAETAVADEKEANSWEVESAVSDFGNLDFGLDDGDLLAGTDVVGTKLDLARAYIDMGDNDSARDILKEVSEEGNDQQKQEASSLMAKIA